MPDEARQNPAVPARSPRYPRLHAWLQLVRLPNLFTVPGDPLVGYVLALWTLHGPEPTPISLGQALWVVLASVTLYAGGLISNDLFDLEEDRRDRPERPLPSGRVSVRSALVAAIVMFIGGIACSTSVSGVGSTR